MHESQQDYQPVLVKNPFNGELVDVYPLFQFFNSIISAQKPTVPDIIIKNDINVSNKNTAGNSSEETESLKREIEYLKEINSIRKEVSHA